MELEIPRLLYTRPRERKVFNPRSIPTPENSGHLKFTILLLVGLGFAGLGRQIAVSFEEESHMGRNVAYQVLHTSVTAWRFFKGPVEDPYVEYLKEEARTIAIKPVLG